MICVDSSNILFRAVFAVSQTFEKPYSGISFVFEGRESVLVSDPDDEEIEINKAGKNIFVTKDEFENIWMRYNIGLIISSYLLSIFKLKRDFAASYTNLMVLAVDGSDSWRKKFFNDNKHKMLVKEQTDTYKGQRKREENPIVNWQILFEMYDETLEAMKNYSDYVVVKVNQAEADDVIAVIVKDFIKSNPDEHVFIISSDEDFAQITSDKVHLWSLHHKKFLNYDNPKRFLISHIMTGDKADNIPAIEKRMGDATALKRIDSGLENYLATNAEIRERYEINKTLIDFNRIPKEVTDKILEEYGSQFCDQYEQMEITRFCWKYGLRKIVEHMRDFKLLKCCSDSQITASVKNKPNVKQIMNNALLEFLNGD